MSVLDWSFVILLSGAFLFSLLSVLFFVSFLLVSRKYKPLKKKRPPKNKKKRRQFVQLRKQLEKQRKSRRLWTVLCVLFAGASLGSGLYSRNYQQNHLPGEDADALVQSYFLLEDATLQLTNIQSGENPQKSLGNIHEITSRLASYGARRASLGIAEDGQTLLNRHFATLKELGINLNSQTLEDLQNGATADGYLADIQRVQESQSEVFKRFSVNEEALMKKK